MWGGMLAAVMVAAVMATTMIPAWAKLDCAKVERGVDYAICSSDQLMGLIDNLQSAWEARKGQTSGDEWIRLLADQRAWVKDYGPACGLPAQGRPSDTQIVGTRSCVETALRQRITVLQRGSTTPNAAVVSAPTPSIPSTPSTPSAEQAGQMGAQASLDAAQVAEEAARSELSVALIMRSKAQEASELAHRALANAERAVQAAEEKHRKAEGAVIIAKGGYTPGQTIRDCSICPEMVVVPAGSFVMGSPSNEPKRADAEGPLHKVTISRPFAVGKHEVTFAEWDAYVTDDCCGGYRPDDKGWGRGRRPVISVSWHGAQGYIAWLRRKTGKQYRLLSEAEWEYVARAGTTTPFSTGPRITSDQANFDGNYTYMGSSKGVYRQRTVEVGSFKPNPFGLYDVHGNVWEWVEDCWHDSYGGAPSDESAWIAGRCEHRVLRGGSWSNYPWTLRSAQRVSFSPDARSVYGGFRLARSLTLEP